MKDSYEKKQVQLAYKSSEEALFKTREFVSGAVIRTNFGESGSLELQEAHKIFKEVDNLLYEASRKLRDIEDML
ncbi:hypothetical protein ACI1UB_11000 [Lactococcus petauri]|uniref:hypothetical protein n=1 Tax=Lactococcus petauri TaxID=1940789 RepID=UPI001A9CB180